jgi:hypothetical protein
LKHFPSAAYKNNEWVVVVNSNNYIHFSYSDVAQGVIFFNQHKIKLPTVTKFITMEKFIRKAVRKYLIVDKKTKVSKWSLEQWILPSAYAGWFFSDDPKTVELEDILVLSISGYVSTNYKEAGYISVNVEYIEKLANTLTKEAKQATKECQVTQNLMLRGKGQLSVSMRNIIDSLQSGDDDSKMMDYKILSSILAKHTRNKYEAFKHEDFRKAHPECIKAEKLNDQRCNQLKEEMGINSDTPLYGSYMKRKFTPTAGIFFRQQQEIELYSQALEDDCHQLVRKLLPISFSRDDFKTYGHYTDNICSSIKDLKECLQDIARIDDKNRSSKKSPFFYEPYNPKDEMTVDDNNSILDKFQGVDSMSR